VSIGRAYIHGLGALGEAGVTRALEILKKEADITMALCGETRITDLGLHNIWGGVPEAAPVVEEPRERALAAVGA
jgi:L-lactate dehydrogenase (cytochrome)